MRMRTVKVGTKRGFLCLSDQDSSSLELKVLHKPFSIYWRSLSWSLGNSYIKWECMVSVLKEEESFYIFWSWLHRSGNSCKKCSSNQRRLNPQRASCNMVTFSQRYEWALIWNDHVDYYYCLPSCEHMLKHESFVFGIQNIIRLFKKKEKKNNSFETPLTSASTAAHLWLPTPGRR